MRWQQQGKHQLHPLRSAAALVPLTPARDNGRCVPVVQGADASCLEELCCFFPQTKAPTLGSGAAVFILGELSSRSLLRAWWWDGVASLFWLQELAEEPCSLLLPALPALPAGGSSQAAKAPAVGPG